MRSAVTAMALTSFAASATPNAPPVQGQWWTPGFNAPVRIETCGDDAARGGVVWLRGGKPQGIADKTPLVGQLVIDRMKRAKPDACADGRLDNPDESRDDQDLVRAQLQRARTRSWSSTAACLLSARPRCGGVPPGHGASHGLELLQQRRNQLRHRRVNVHRA
jgi:uncharacterized protein (DUF2147 family)